MEAHVLRQLKDARFHSSFDEYSNDGCEDEERLQDMVGDGQVDACRALEEGGTDSVDDDERMCRDEIEDEDEGL